MRATARAKSSPRKSGTDSIDAIDYPAVLTKLCREADVLIVPTVQKLSANLDVAETTPRKTSERLDSFLQQSSEVEVEDVFALCAPSPPPAIQVAYDWTESGENPIGVVCKAFYIEYALIRGIFTSLFSFPTITSLKIEDCCIGRDIAKFLSGLLLDPPGKNIVDLSLDGNCDIAEEIPSLLRTGLRYLSLRRCSIDDRAMRLISEELAFSPDREQKLSVLNLNMNNIGDEGMVALSDALRTNRSLVFLSLCGNRITDVGASRLAAVLGRFPLTNEEVTDRRRKVFDRLLLKKVLTDKLIEDWKTKNETESQMRIKSSDRIKDGKRTKPFEATAKRPSTSGREKKRASSVVGSSREKLRAKKRSSETENVAGSLEPSAAEMKEMLQRVESEIATDRHPFITEVTASDNELWCEGNWKLGSINLSYNRITEESLETFVSVIYYQDKAFRPPHQGLIRLIIVPGNPIPRNSTKIDELKCVLQNRSQKTKNVPDGSQTGLQSVESPSARPRKGSTSPKKK